MEKDNNMEIFTKTDKTKVINIIEKENYKDLEENELLTLAIEKLPKNYNFEIYKSIKKIREISKEKNKKKPLIALQFPEGLLIFSLLISDILENFAECETIILGDITYGACCIDDIGCSFLDCDLIIHYAHSCLKPNKMTLIKVMYIFVEIKIDIEHLIKTIELNFPKEQNDFLYLLSSLQYNSTLFVLKRKLIENGYDKNNINIPQIKPRVIGEIIGCTSPILEKKKENCYIIFICDGRFHMESLMIQNPNFKYFQYNPFTKYLTIEEYDIELMKKIRFEQIEKLKESKLIGVIFGTLGRQGSKGILNRINKLLNENNKDFINICLNEITEEKISQFKQCDCFIQIACPRLSIDWSNQFSKPMLTPYESYIAFGKIGKSDVYRMDNYANDTGEWGHLFKEK